jgi:hypothetical protein
MSADAGVFFLNDFSIVFCLFIVVSFQDYIEEQIQVSNMCPFCY